jgi:hypothetical protein
MDTHGYLPCLRSTLGKCLHYFCFLRLLERMYADCVPLMRYKGHRYLTITLDFSTGAVIFAGQGKGGDTLEPFRERLRRNKAKKIKAVVIDIICNFCMFMQFLHLVHAIFALILPGYHPVFLVDIQLLIRE